MAALEAYGPCPCGSGQKYKWCCQKVEPFAQKSARLQETGAVEPAKAALDEGLAKYPHNPWLTIRKAMLLARQEKTKEAAEILRGLVAHEPKHAGAYNFLIRATLETEGSGPAIAQLQQALSNVAPEHRTALAITAQILGMILAEEGHVPAGLAHLELAEALEPEDDDLGLARSLRTIEANASISAWLRNPYPLSTAPDGLPADRAETFAKAIGWSGEGLWSSAASAFEALAASGVIEAERNAGLLRLQLAEDATAAAALRRHIAAKGDTPDVADLEALCQIIAPARGGELVGHVQLIWNMRDRDGLLKRLNEDASVAAEGPGPIDEDDPNSPQVEWFALLDRPKPAADAQTIDANAVPHVEARVTIGREIAALDILDDGRLDRLRDRLVELAGSTLPPAHPRTKSLGPVSRVSAAMNAELWLPEGLPREERLRLTQVEHERIIRDVWPSTPMPYLNGRTPRQAAKDGDAVMALRAAINQFELGQSFSRGGVDFDALRADLNVPPEPEIDPAAVDIETLHLSRLHRVPVDRLDDARLVALFERAHRYVLPLAMERAASELVGRPSVFESGQVDRVLPFADLANLALSRRAPQDEAFVWVAKGRSADRTPENAVRWDFLDLRLRARSEKPEEWVPQLAVLLERYAEDRTASSSVMSNLMDMGLVQMVPNPDESGQMLLDTRPLQAVLAQYGPKITTASGRLGVSATQGNIWTPGSAAPAGGSTTSGGIWTPGSGAAPASGGGGDKPKLIIPGR